MSSEVRLLQGALDTKAGPRGLAKDTERWRRLAGVVDALLLNEP
jgi:hypothetical protein